MLTKLHLLLCSSVWDVGAVCWLSYTFAALCMLLHEACQPDPQWVVKRQVYVMARVYSLVAAPEPPDPTEEACIDGRRGWYIKELLQAPDVRYDLQQDEERCSVVVL